MGWSLLEILQGAFLEKRQVKNRERFHPRFLVLSVI